MPTFFIFSPFGVSHHLCSRQLRFFSLFFLDAKYGLKRKQSRLALENVSEPTIESKLMQPCIILGSDSACLLWLSSSSK